MASTAFEFLDFENTEIAFSYMSDKEIKQLKSLFGMMNSTQLVSLGSALMPLALKLKLPFTKTIIKKTIFKQFVGGETLLESQRKIDLLYKYKTQTIIDYGAESKSTEDDLDAVVTETTKAVEFAASNNSVPAISTKITGLADNDLLVKIQSGVLLSTKEKQDKEKLYNRLDTICKRAYDLKVGVMVDAEESWMQIPMDNLVRQMMAEYNKNEVIVYNTYQLYRHDKLADFKRDFELARAGGYYMGAKLVRGAYMEKERQYAEENGLKSVLNSSKEDTDLSYDKALTFSVDNHKYLSTICASHNAKSSMLFAHIIEKRNIDKKHPHLNFCQLLGMSDNLTFNLAKAGYNVAKYVPYGPINEVIPYLLRRAKENSSVTGDMSRELSYIVKEIKRRKL